MLIAETTFMTSPDTISKPFNSEIIDYLKFDDSTYICNPGSGQVFLSDTSFKNKTYISWLIQNLLGYNPNFYCSTYNTKKEIFVGTDHGIFKYDYNTKQISRFAFSINDYIHNVTSLFADSNNYIYTISDGLILYTANDGQSWTNIEENIVNFVNYGTNDNFFVDTDGKMVIVRESTFYADISDYSNKKHLSIKYVNTDVYKNDSINLSLLVTDDNNVPVDSASIIIINDVKNDYDTLITNMSGMAYYTCPLSKPTIFENLYYLGYYAAKANCINSDISYINCTQSSKKKFKYTLCNFQDTMPFCLPGTLKEYDLTICDSNHQFVPGKIIANNYFLNTTNTIDFDGNNAGKYSFLIAQNTKYGMYKMQFKGVVDNDSTDTYKTYLIVTDFINFIEIPWDVPENPIQAIIYYPNPATDYLKITTENQKFEIFNIMGIKVLESNNENYIYIGNLSPGIYFLKAGGKYYKFVKI